MKYPALALQLKKHASEVYVRDLVRKKWLKLTPEEWVRQHLVHHLHVAHGVPFSLMGLEKELQLNDLKKRFDLVVYGRNKEPWLVAECKAPYIALDREVLEQAMRYNLVLKARYLMISNGISDLVLNSRNEEVPLPVFTLEEG